MELVSGPDVGGGFLFQLTRERTEPRATFTIHAQEGGLDGGARRPGMPDRVGFERSNEMCSIGGRHCYHRAFEIDLKQTTQVRFAYNRLRFVIGPMLEQLAGERPIRFTEGMDELLPRVASHLAKLSAPWMVGGSASAALQGVELAPRDVDIVTTEAGVVAIGEALSEFLIEPPAVTRWGDGPARWAGRAFVGTLTDGVRVEWAAALAEGVGAAGPALEWTAQSLAHPQTVERSGIQVAVSPLEYALSRALKARDSARTDALVSRLAKVGVDRTLLTRLLEADRPARELLGQRLTTAPTSGGRSEASGRSASS
ncbi:MAG: hypothetical protein L3K17_05445 [Thermoplasmata archaeon]|nr:hypothetical protein [Thermoplasmata archaeon]